MPSASPSVIPRCGPGVYAGNACVASRNVYRPGTPESTVVRLVGRFWSPPPPGMLFSVLSCVAPDTYVDVSVYNDFASVVNSIARAQEDPSILAAFMPCLLHSDLWLGILRDLPPRFTPPWDTLHGADRKPKTPPGDIPYVFGPELSPAESLRTANTVSACDPLEVTSTTSSSLEIGSAFESNKAHEYDARERPESDLDEFSRRKPHAADTYSREYFHVTHPYAPDAAPHTGPHHRPRIIAAIVVKCADPEPLRYNLRTGLPSSTAEFARRVRRSYQHRPYPASRFASNMAVARMTGNGPENSTLTGLTSSRATAAPLWRRTLDIMGATPELTDRSGVGVDALLPPSGRREWPRSVSVGFPTGPPRRCFADVEGQLGGVVPLAGDSSVVLLSNVERVGVILSVSTWSKRKAKRHDTPLLLRVATAADVSCQGVTDRAIVPVVGETAARLVLDAPVKACLVDIWGSVSGDAVVVAIGFAPTVSEQDRTGLCELVQGAVAQIVPAVDKVIVSAERMEAN